ncbi:hypothetical protein QF025_000171 [Paraburkholderia graminis]|uniref:Uncharacterized protein n=1 Tax=Paraburkholderia graminis TaxID=60548 RepID=A0ABD5C994_9BURK|nr:hypothetical protein [Paraburkholderia graminis]
MKASCFPVIDQCCWLDTPSVTRDTPGDRRQASGKKNAGMLAGVVVTSTARRHEGAGMEILLRFTAIRAPQVVLTGALAEEL